MTSSFNGRPLQSMVGLRVEQVEFFEVTKSLNVQFSNAGVTFHSIFWFEPEGVEASEFIGHTIDLVDESDGHAFRLGFSNGKYIVADLMTSDGLDDWAPEKMIYSNDSFDPPLCVVVRIGEWEDRST